MNKMISLETGSSMEEWFKGVTLPFRHPIWRKYTIYSGLSCAFISILQIFYFTQYSTYFLENLYVHTLTVYAVVLIITTNGFLNIMEGSENLRKAIWKVVNPATMKEIEKYVMWEQKNRIIFTILSLLTCIISVPPNQDIDKSSILFKLLDLSGDKRMNILERISFQCTMLYLSYISSTLMFMFLFYGKNISYALFILRKELIFLSEIKRRRTYNNDSEYQDEVQALLKKCVIRHQKILRYARQIERRSIFLFTISHIAGIACIGAPLYCLLHSDQTTFETFQTLAFLLYVLFTYAEYGILGQEMLDANNAVRNALYNCPWYTWNARNRKSFLLFAMGMQRDFHVRTISNKGFDFPYLIMQCRNGISFLTLVESVNVSK